MDWTAESTKIRNDRGVLDYTPLKPFVANRTLDRSLWYEGQLIVTYAQGAEVDNTCCIWEGNCPGGMGPPPHVHLYEHEIFFIIEGKLRAWVEGVEFEVPKDSMIFLPAGRTHWFLSDAPVTRIFSLTVTASKNLPRINENTKLFEFLGQPAEAMTLPAMPDTNKRPDIEGLRRVCEENGTAILDVDRHGWRRAFGKPNADGKKGDS
jgi:mannose-6-phosphate isomerase-like protein (cupin superfamily)